MYLYTRFSSCALWRAYKKGLLKIGKPDSQSPENSTNFRGAARGKSPNMQSFGIKIERIDRDLLCIYETAGKRVQGYICLHI